MFVGRGFSRDINGFFSSGVLTPEGSKLHFSVACLAAGAKKLCGVKSKLW
jgi:hypothetical protein